jgi:N-carbamoylputrescine amidase
MTAAKQSATVLAVLSLITGACTNRSGPVATRSAAPPAEVTVAAIQMHSVLGDVPRNLKRIEALVEEASAKGARICVLPECAIPGYADLTNDVFWSTEDEDGYLQVRSVAETIPGPSTSRLAHLADRLDLYLTAPLIERAEVDGTEVFYNSVALIGPEGRIRATYRKRVLWTVADTYWASEGPEEVCTIDTEYGRLGLMICRDVHVLVGELGEAGVDIILDCVAWYGPNSDGWFSTKLAWMVKDANAHLVLANWTFPEDPGWSGYGLSRIIDPEGELAARCSSDIGDEIVCASVPMRQGR